MSKQKIIDVAVEHARAGSYLTIHRTEIAAEAGVAVSLVSYHFGSVEGVRDAVMQWAVDNNDHVIVAQGLVHGHPIAINAPASVRSLALSELYTASGV